MHRESLDTMARLLDRYADWLPESTRTVLDVGAYDVNGTYRETVESRGLIYTGADLQPGPNVDLVMGQDTIYRLYDIVISGQTLEHCDNPFTLMQTMCSHADRLVIAIAPWYQPLHRYPIDCWRIMPDGMERLIQAAGWQVADVGMDHRDTYGVAIPPSI